MSAKLRVPENTEVPISAMIDVVFLLLAFFIMTAATIKDEAHVSITLPKDIGTPGPPVPTYDIYVFNTHKEGQYVYNFQNRNYTEDQLDVYLSNITQDHDQADNMILNLKVALDAKHKRVIDIVDLLKKHGIEKINVLSLKEGFAKK